MYENVAVFIEQRENIIQSVSLELLAVARILADEVSENVIAIVLGNNIESIAKECIYYGADHVILVDDICLKEYSTEPYTQALVDIISKQKYNIFLIGATTIGRDLAPRISARIRTGLVADCTQLMMMKDSNVLDPRKILLMTRPTFGGNMISTIICPNSRPQMATVRPSTMDKPKYNTKRQGIINSYSMDFNTNKFRVEILETVLELKQDKPITEYKALIVGGRGIQHKTTYQQLFTIAQKIEVGVGVSRGLVEYDWADHKIQVGQTGKTVSPVFYLALGISGAIQHITGMERSDCIIAVNNDKNAPIFKFAHIGIISDVEKIIPLLVERVSKIN